MSIAQHPDKWWDWFMPEDEEKKKKKKNRSNIY